MISKTIGFRGTNHFQTHPYVFVERQSFLHDPWILLQWCVNRDCQPRFSLLLRAEYPNVGGLDRTKIVQTNPQEINGAHVRSSMQVLVYWKYY